VSLDRTGPLQIIQKFGSWHNAGDKQVIPRTRAGDLQQMALRVVKFFEIAVVSQGLNSRLQGNGFAVTGPLQPEILTPLSAASSRWKSDC
jgi:hypothetical protein